MKELAIQKDPENISVIEKEYSKNMENLDYRQKRGLDLMKVAKSFTDYARRQANLREKIRQEEIQKLQEETGHLTDAQWKSREEELCRETLQQIDHQRIHLLQKESEWAQKIRKQVEMSQQLAEKCKNIKTLESKLLTELRNQLQEKQLEAERHWSELTNTWVAEKISKDSKIDELKAALETVTEQQAAMEHAWKTAVDKEKTEKIAQVNNLIEKVRGMEIKQQEIRQDMEQ